MNQLKRIVRKMNLRTILAILVLWDCIVFSEIFMHFYLDRGLLDTAALPLGLGWRVLTVGLLLSLGVMLTVGTIFLYGVRLVKIRWLIILGNGVFLWLFGLLYICSWALFVTNKAFLDQNTLAIFWNSPWQTYQHFLHMTPVVAVTFPTLLFVCCWGLAFGVEKWSQHINAKFSRRMVLGHVVLVVVASLFVKLMDSRYQDISYCDRKSLAVMQPSEFLGILLRLKTDPISSLTIDVFRKNPLRSSSDEPDKFVLPHRKIPQISLDQFVAGVNESRIQKKNVILLLVESLRPDMLTLGGSSEAFMPNLDALSRRSIFFNDVYTQASHSNYADVCTLSSHYPLRSVEPHFYPKNPAYPRVLIYDVLKHLGYRTAIISSQNENWGSMANYLESENLDHFFHSLTFDGPTYVPHGDVGFANYAIKTGSGKIDDRYTVEEAIKWINSDADQSFFIYMNLQNSHIPFQIPTDFDRKYSPEKLDFEIAFGHFPKDKIDVVKAVYADSLRYIDHQFNRLLEALNVSGRLDDTIIIVTGDTGQAFYEHDFASHASYIYDEVMRVPLFFFSSTVPPKIVQKPAQHIDIAPTLFGLLGLPAHPSFQGVNLLDDHTKPSRTRFLLAQAIKDQYGIVRNDFKMIYSPNRRMYELYNLAEDPAESRNLMGEDTQLESDLKKRLHSWIELQLEYYGNLQGPYPTYPPHFLE